MTLIATHALGVTLGDPLFLDLDLTLAKGDRLGLVAANGRGKSTLLACLAGQLDPTAGEITRARGLQVGHVTQNLPEENLTTSLYDLVLGALGADEAEHESWRVDVLLDDLDIPPELHTKPLGTLSGGWQRTALLAAAWVREPDVLLLDEPTNHLDLYRIGLLQDWLGALPRHAAVVITSHDRAFLDAVTNRTLFLRTERSRLFNLPFSAARSALDVADAADDRQFANDLNKARQLRKQAAKLKNVGINSGSDLLLTKTKQLTKRAEAMEAQAKPAHTDRSAGEIRLANSGTHAKALLTLDDVPICAADGRLLYTTGKKWISPGDRVVLLASNGAGKTRLIKTIVRALGGEANGVKPAASIVPAYADQDLSQLDDSATPIATVTERFEIGDQRARALLAGAGIAIQMQTTKICALSGGQKSRLAMLILRLQNPNFYLLDEPTNHLDIEGQEKLEEELIAHGAASLLVSHDRSFVRNVGNRFWRIERRRLVELDGPDAFLRDEMGRR